MHRKKYDFSALRKTAELKGVDFELCKKFARAIVFNGLPKSGVADGYVPVLEALADAKIILLGEANQGVEVLDKKIVAYFKGESAVVELGLFGRQEDDQVHSSPNTTLTPSY